MCTMFNGKHYNFLNKKTFFAFVCIRLFINLPADMYIFA